MRILFQLVVAFTLISCGFQKPKDYCVEVLNEKVSLLLDNKFKEFEIKEIKILSIQNTPTEYKVKAQLLIEFPSPKESNVKNTQLVLIIAHINRNYREINYLDGLSELLNQEYIYSSLSFFN